MADVTYNKELLSESSNGRPILIAATTSPGTLVHTATSTSGELDEMWIYVANDDSSEVEYTVEFGGTSSSDKMTDSVPGKRKRTAVVGEPIGGTSGLEIRIYADTTNVLRVTGYSNRILPTETS